MIAVVATVLVFACPTLVVWAYVSGVRYERRRQARGRGRGRATVTIRRPEDLSWGWTRDEVGGDR